MAVASQSGATPTTSCFGGAVGYTFSGLRVRVRACSHQVLDHLRPPGATFSLFGVTCSCWLDVLAEVRSPCSGSAITRDGPWFVQTQEGSEESGMLHQRFPSLEGCLTLGISLRSSQGALWQLCTQLCGANIWMAAARLLPSCCQKPAGLAWASVSRSRYPLSGQMLEPPCPR